MRVCVSPWASGFVLVRVPGTEIGNGKSYQVFALLQIDGVTFYIQFRMMNRHDVRFCEIYLIIILFVS